MSDFLTQVQEAEQQAAVLLEKAAAKNQKALQKYRAELASELKAEDEKWQEKTKEKVLASRAESRNNYETQVQASEGEAKKLEVERTAQVGALLPNATTFLLEILS